jgi:hypothetical protein
MAKTIDQTFKSLNAKLETTAAPYNPFVKSGNPNDPAAYLVQPGVNFVRPWLAIRNGPAFQWPLGLEGYSLTVDPLLALHKFIGDNAVTVDVLHAGEENFTMSGNFPGNSAPALIRALRDLVYQGAPAEGKILYVPEIMSHAQRVQVVHFESTRQDTDRGRDAAYSIQFVRLGTLNAISSMAMPVIPLPQKTTGKQTVSTRSVTVDAQHNTARKIAKWKLGDTTRWRTIYDANESWYTGHSVPLTKVPDYRLPTGLKVHL